MKLKALSHYDGDLETRYGDSILVYNANELIVYDCGHEKHSAEIKRFLNNNGMISTVHVVVSHNDNDHTKGVCGLLDWLAEQGTYIVKVYTHQYLKHVDAILDKIDDGRRKRDNLKEALLEEFDNIKDIIETAQKYKFDAIEALKGTVISNSSIVGPTIEQFVEVAAQAVDSRVGNTVGTGKAAETVMNAASIQLKCILQNSCKVLLCGDASPDYLTGLDNYQIIQLPHHGQLNDAQAIFDSLRDPYAIDYLISDNTGSGETSGGSGDLVEYMKEWKYKPAYNTQHGVVDIPSTASCIPCTPVVRGVKLGGLDFSN